MKDLTDPTNRDTVPAMLTPGEFVLNKEATQMFGPQIEAMNNAGLQQRAMKNAGGMISSESDIGYNNGGIVGFLKEKEGWREEAYQDQAGVWTIGYGRTTNPDGSPVKPGQTTTRKAEDKWIQSRAASDRKATEEFAKKHGYEWSPQQIDALTSFRYNIGNLDQLTAGGTRTNEQIAEMLPQYNKVTVDGKKVPSEGLTNRRDAELKLFTGGTKDQTVATAEVPPPMQEVPQPAEAGFPDHRDAINLAVEQVVQPRQPVTHQPMVQSFAPQQPQYIPSVTEKKPVQSFNRGGRADRKKKTSNLWNDLFNAPPQQPSRGRNAPPRIQTQAPPQPMRPPGQGPAAARPTNDYQPLQAEVQRGLIPPQAAGVPPQVQDLPPVPGSDEAILQGSSQQVEKRETNARGQPVRGKVDPTAQPVPKPTNAQGQPVNQRGQPLRGTVDAQTEVAQPQMNPQGQQVNQRGQPIQGTVPPVAAPPGLGDAGAAPAGPSVDVTPSSPPEDKKRNQAEGIIATVDKEEPPTGEQPPADDIVAAGQAEMQDQTKMKGAFEKVQGAFGDLFDKGELARMAVVFLGAMATGASPGRALAISGQMYLNRIDAKASTHNAHINKLVQDGDYTTQSIKAYKDSGDPSMLMPSSQTTPLEELGNQKTFYTKGGQRIQAREVKVGDNKYWVDGNNKPVNLNNTHQDASRAEGTPEYRKRIGDESKQLSKTFEEMQERFGKYETKDGEAYTTDLTPGKVGLNAAKWALENDVPIDAMGQLLENAYTSARNDSKDGKRAKSITAYLNDQYVQSQVGDPSLFQTTKGETVAADKVNELMNIYASQLKDSPAYQGMSTAAISTSVIQAARPKWMQLDEGTRKSYNRRAGSNESGFMVWLRDQLRPQ